MHDSIMNRRKRTSDVFVSGLINLSAAFSVILLAGIIAYVFVKGIRSVNLQFLTTVTSTLNKTVGIAGNIVNTLYIIVITLLIATPVGIGSAIYLNEYAKPGKLVRATFRYSIYYFWYVWYDVFWNRTRTWLLHSDRLSYADAYGIAADHKEYAGSVKNGTGQLPERCPGNGGNEMVYDPDDPAAERGTGDSDRRHPFDWPYRGRVGGASVYCRKRLPATEKPVWKTV